jgi:hypothetical protein
MGGEDDSDLDAAAAAEALALVSSSNQADTLARMLSDTRYVVNVPSLSLLEDEIRSRDLPIGRQH